MAWRRGRCRWWCGLLAAAGVGALVWAAPAVGSGLAFWTNLGGRIGYAALDDTGAPSGTLTVGGGPLGVVIDSATDTIYWASSSPHRIESWNLDTPTPERLATGDAPVSFPHGLAFDPETDTLYWANLNNYNGSCGPHADFPSGCISVLDLKTGHGERLHTAAGTVNHPNAVTVDRATGQLYWTNFYDKSNSIGYAPLNDHGHGGTLVITGTMPDVPVGVAVDEATNTIYWTNGSGTDRIGFANLVGLHGQTLDIARTPHHVNPVGLAIDHAANRIYWANIDSCESPSDPGCIWSANLKDGSDGRRLDTGQTTPNHPRFVALWTAPVAEGAPTVSGDLTTGSTLTCGPGTWAEDLEGAFLFRAPNPSDYSYSWTRNGAAIPGQSTIVASTAGEYVCQVTARNHAGTAVQASARYTVTTPPPGERAPHAMTGAASGVTHTSATLHGMVNPHGLATTYHFQYGTSTSYRRRTASGSVGLGSSTRSVSQAISGLAPGTTYHYRIVAMSAGGESVGADHTFTTPATRPRHKPTPKPRPKPTPPSFTG